jgi:hypothetical protein
MKVSEDKWIKATENLMIRRQWNGHADDNRSLDNAIRDYRSHLAKCGYGRSVLDVGCGSQTIKRCLTKNVRYIGIDAFPLSGVDCLEVAVEDYEGEMVDTVVAFAVLDNCRDFYKACEVMIKKAKKNVIILTGIGIEVDKYHTFKLEHEHFDKAFQGLTRTHFEELTPKVWLINYQK